MAPKGGTTVIWTHQLNSGWQHEGIMGHSTPSGLKLKKVPTIMVSNFLQILTVGLVKC